MSEPMDMRDLRLLLQDQWKVSKRLQVCYRNLIKTTETKDEFMNEGRLEFIEALLKVTEGTVSADAEWKDCQIHGKFYANLEKCPVCAVPLYTEY